MASKGVRGWVMHWRNPTGRERFDAFLRAYFDHFAFQSITTESFLAYLRRELPNPVPVEDWIYQPGITPGAAEPHSDAFSLIGGRRSFAGSLIGGIRETQEMLDFCAEHGIAPETELIGADRINDAYERVLASQVRYRFVIDAATLA